MQKRKVAARELATQLNPINHNFTCSRCNMIAKLNAAPQSHFCPSCMLACTNSFEVYCMQSDCPAVMHTALNTNRTTDGRRRSKNTLIMLSGWTASCGVRQRFKAKWMYWVHHQLRLQTAVQVEHRLNLTRSIGKMATRINRRFLAMSDAL